MKQDFFISLKMNQNNLKLLLHTEFTNLRKVTKTSFIYFNVYKFIINHIYIDTKYLRNIIANLSKTNVPISLILDFQEELDNLLTQNAIFERHLVHKKSDICKVLKSIFNKFHIIASKNSKYMNSYMRKYKKETKKNINIFKRTNKNMKKYENLSIKIFKKIKTKWPKKFQFTPIDIENLLFQYVPINVICEIKKPEE